MYVIHIALGGCLAPPPVSYGLTEDTGGHIGYVLGAAAAQARHPRIDRVDIVTRGFDAPEFGASFACPREAISANSDVIRLFTGERRYLDKGRLAAELPEIEAEFLRLLSMMHPRPGIIHAHFADAARLALAARRRFGIPFVYTPHSLGIDKRSALCAGQDVEARIAAEGRAIAGADAIIGSSRDETERQVTAYGLGAAGRTHCVPPGVTLPPFEGISGAVDLIRPFLRDPDKPIVLAVARPVRKKNLPMLVEAFAAHADLSARANLVIVAGQRDGPETGNEEQRETVRALLDAVDRHDLWGRVALPRRHRPSDVPGLYALTARTGGVFANPALFEPFGLTLVEAAAFGLPVVATCHGGPAEIVSEIGHGRLVEPRDPREIGAACHELIFDETASRQARHAARTRSKRYAWSAWSDRVVQIYDAVLPRGPRPVSRRRIERIVASDIDGTLTGSRGGAMRFAEWERARDPARTAFVVATGRSVGDARRVLAAWGLPEPDAFITSVGTEIWRPSGTGRLDLCPGFARLIAADWDRAGIAACLAGEGATPQPAHEQRDWKLSYFGNPAEARRIEALVSDHGFAARIVPSHGRFIDVLPASAGKAAAVVYEAARSGIDLGGCIAAGDSGNDLDMLTACGRAILPANALPEIAHLAGPGILRTEARYADGVLEGLARLEVGRSLREDALR